MTPFLVSLLVLVGAASDKEHALFERYQVNSRCVTPALHQMSAITAPSARLLEKRKYCVLFVDLRRLKAVAVAAPFLLYVYMYHAASPLVHRRVV